MFKNIIWATDGSESSNRALPLVKSLASEADGTLTVIHVVERIAAGKSFGLTRFANEDEVLDEVKKSVAQLADEGLNVTLQIIDEFTMQPAHTIGELARETGADLIVIGTRGHSALAGLLLGSVTQRLLHFAPCPVLAVPPMPTPVAEQPERSEYATA
jgi:nucleotide-binding universal stress UspA family protein